MFVGLLMAQLSAVEVQKLKYDMIQEQKQRANDRAAAQTAAAVRGAVGSRNLLSRGVGGGTRKRYNH